MTLIKTKRNMMNPYHGLSLLIAITIAATILPACGDFRDELVPPTPEAPTSQPVPQPVPGSKPHGETEEQRDKRLCDAERKWALESSLIDLNQFRLYENRNFSPVFNTPGVRQSGIDGWLKCDKALEINGFIPRKPVDAQPIAVATAPPSSGQAFGHYGLKQQVAFLTAATPETPPATQAAREDEETNKMCEEERDYVLKARLTDANLVRMFKKRNFAPVYEISGERESGIESWQPCLTSLRINGFIWY